MFKFLRKYNKWILAVFGTLLMVVFLAGGTIQRLFQGAGAGTGTVATVGPDNERVSAREWHSVQSEVQLIRQLTAIIPQAVRGTLAGTAESPEQWYLLVREADEAGLIGGEYSFEQVAAQLENAPSLSQPRQFIRQTLTKMDGVNRLSMLYTGSGKYSDRRLRNIARRKFHTVNAELAVIEAQATEDVSEPTEEELAAQLEEYADVPAGEGEMGFGYRLPHRAKLEWMGISEEGVRTMVAESDEMSDLALRMHWNRHAGDEDLGFPEVDPTGDVPQVVRDHLLGKLTREKLDAIAKYAYDELRKKRRGLPETELGYVKLPEDWEQRRLSFPDLAQMIQDKFGIRTPEYHASGGEWLTAEDMRKLQPIGQAGTEKYGTQRMSLAELVLAAKDLEGSTSVLIQTGVAGPPLRMGSLQSPDSEGPRPVYLFRILESDASRPPTGVVEVREQLVRDLKRREHYEGLVERLAEIEAQARESGLLTVAVEHDTFIRPAIDVSLCQRGVLEYFLQQGMPIQMFPSDLPVVQRDEETIKKILDRALALPEGRPLADAAEEQRTFVLKAPDHLALLVVRLLEQKPLSEELFERLSSSQLLQASLRVEELDEGAMIEEVFSFEALAARHNFAFTREGEEEAPAEAEPGTEEELVEASTAG